MRNQADILTARQVFVKVYNELVATIPNRPVAFRGPILTTIKQDIPDSARLEVGRLVYDIANGFEFGGVSYAITLGENRDCVGEFDCDISAIEFHERGELLESAIRRNIYLAQSLISAKMDGEWYFSAGKRAQRMKALIEPHNSTLRVRAEPFAEHFYLPDIVSIILESIPYVFRN